MQKFSCTPVQIISSFWRNQSLIRALVKREIAGRYRGSILGVLWSFFNPFLMLAVYSFVFSIVFKSRWRVEATSQAEFALILFAGLIVFNLFAECIGRSPSLITANVNYVKKVVFPLEILPWVTLGSAIFHAAVSGAVWAIAYIIFFGSPPITTLLLPLVILPLLLFTMGLSWWLASLGVFLRDVSQVVGVFLTAMMFLSPIFYPASAVPDEFRPFLIFNPLTTVIEQVREAMFWGSFPDWYLLAISFCLGLTTMWLGFAWFQKTRKGFADVI